MTNLNKFEKTKNEIKNETWEDDCEFADYLALLFKQHRYDWKQKIDLVKSNSSFDGGDYWAEQFLKINGLI